MPYVSRYRFACHLQYRDIRNITYFDPHDMSKCNFEAPFRPSLQGDLRRRSDSQHPLRRLRQLQARERHFLAKVSLRKLS
jgi:hypothetical protein